MRGKLIPWEDSDISTHFRIIYFFDTEVGENVYLYLAYYFWNSDPGWKDIVLKRYIEYIYSLQKIYLTGEMPIWRSP